MKYLLPLLFAISAHAAYPPTWWQPVPREQAKSWEILPQDAKPGEVILSKRNELGVFSNFANTPFELDGENYASVEALWQAMKWPEGSKERARVKMLSGSEAKKAGRKTDTVSYQGKKFKYKTTGQRQHYEIIRRAILAKVEQNPTVKALLMKTKGLALKPDHHQPKDAPPSYRYFDILMEIRDQ
jgi:predicted NAD-dependent protein-ADP-ribosyltransferase YbiA (DUF1768 family)